MATKPLDDALAREACEAWLAHGKSRRAASAALGLALRTFENRLVKGQSLGFHLSQGVADSINRIRVSPAEVRGGWIYDRDENGLHLGTHRYEVAKDTVDSEDRLARIRAAFEGMTPLEPMPKPEIVHDDLCNLFHMPDIHLGMFASASQTGYEDYNLPLAVSDLKASFDRVISQTPMGAVAILLFNGDFFHCNDDSKKTFKSKHDLDAVNNDMRDVRAEGVELAASLVRRAASWHRKVIVRAERGNHDHDSHDILRIGLKYAFQNDATVEIAGGNQDYFLHRWGRNVIASAHGHLGSIDQFVMRIPSLCSWSMQDTPHQYAFTGHNHTEKSKRIGPVYWHQADPITTADRYGSQWVGKRSLVRHTFDIVRGRTGTGEDYLERLGGKDMK